MTLEAIESNLYRINKSKDHNEEAYILSIKENDYSNIVIFKEEIEELIELLKKTKEIL